MLIDLLESSKAIGLCPMDMKIYIVIENRADSVVMPPVFSLSKYPIEYLTLDT